MKFFDWLIVLLLNGGVMAYGFYVARGAKTSQDWFLGHRSLSWWAIGLSMFATNVDNADLVSLTGMTYNEGLHIIMVHTLGSLLGASFAAFFLVPTLARAGHFTNAEYLELRYQYQSRSKPFGDRHGLSRDLSGSQLGDRDHKHSRAFSRFLISRKRELLPRATMDSCIYDEFHDPHYPLTRILARRGTPRIRGG